MLGATQCRQHLRQFNLPIGDSLAKHLAVDLSEVSDRQGVPRGHNQQVCSQLVVHTVITDTTFLFPVFV